jgi:hypothetical protein
MLPHFSLAAPALPRCAFAGLAQPGHDPHQQPLWLSDKNFENPIRLFQNVAPILKVAWSVAKAALVYRLPRERSYPPESAAVDGSPKSLADGSAAVNLTAAYPVPPSSSSCGAADVAAGFVAAAI